MKALLGSITIMILALSISGQITVRTPTPRVKTVIAKAGDTVEKVATREGADPVEVAKLNGLLPNSTLFAGREIKIPSSRATIKETRQLALAACTYVMDIGSKEAVAYRLYFQLDTVKRMSDMVEVWTCVEPINPAAFRNLWKLPTSFAYGLQLITIDCERSRETSNIMIPYTRSGQVVRTNAFTLTSEYSKPIVPSSIGEEIKKKVCRL